MIYTVNFSYTESGYVVIEAASEKEAQEILDNHLDDKGLDDLVSDTCDREWFILGADEASHLAM